jgi:tRNA(Ile)-lysidine synthase
MIKLACKLPRKLTIAVSGGVDSMAALDFLNRNHDVTVAFFHNNTENSDRACEFLTKYCHSKQLPLILGWYSKDRPQGQSQEEHWRIQRYQFLEGIQMPVVTAHHLDDCVETYVWSMLHGTAKTVPLRRNNVVRPFLLTKKQELQQWCQRHSIPWSEDLSNQDLRYQRNYVRHQLMPHVRHVNPGIDRVVRRVVERQLVEQALGFEDKLVDSSF